MSLKSFGAFDLKAIIMTADHKLGGDGEGVHAVLVTSLAGLILFCSTVVLLTR